MSERESGKLVQGLGLWASTALVAGNVIGSGIYVIPASLADAAGPLSLLAWPIVALGYLALNAVYADLAEAYPIQGGLQVYTATAFGPLAGLIATTLYWISCVVGNAAFMTAFVGYAAVFFPVFTKPLAAFLLAQLVLWTFTAVNMAGVKAGGAVQTVTTVLKIVPLLVLAVVLLPHADTANLVPFAPKGLGALFPAIALVAWPFLGSETATIPAGEMKDARRTIRRAAFIGLGLAALVSFVDLTEETRLLCQLTATLLPYVILICLAAQLGAVLNALGRFVWPALVPVVLNVVWLAALWWVIPIYWSDPIQQVQAMHDVPRHHVHPAIGHLELAPREVEVERAREATHVHVDALLQLRERGRHPVQARRRTVRGVSARVVSLRPRAPGAVLERKLPAFAQQARIETVGRPRAEPGGIDASREKRS